MKKCNHQLRCHLKSTTITPPEGESEPDTIRNTRKCPKFLKTLITEFPFSFSPSFVQQVQCFIVVDDNSRSGGEGKKATNYSNYTIALSHSCTLFLFFPHFQCRNHQQVAFRENLSSSSSLSSIKEGRNPIKRAGYSTTLRTKLFKYLLKTYYRRINLSTRRPQIKKEGKCVNSKWWCSDRVVWVSSKHLLIDWISAVTVV